MTFAFDYLQEILDVSDATPKLQISFEEYKSFIELLLSTNEPKTRSRDLLKIKASCIDMLTEKYIRSLDNHKIESNFLLLLHYCKSNPELFVQRTIEAIKLFPDKCLDIWKMKFESFTRPNVFIFNYLGENIAKQSTLKSFKLLFYYRKQFKQI